MVSEKKKKKQRKYHRRKLKNLISQWTHVRKRQPTTTTTVYLQGARPPGAKVGFKKRKRKLYPQSIIQPTDRNFGDHMLHVAKSAAAAKEAISTLTSPTKYPSMFGSHGNFVYPNTNNVGLNYVVKEPHPDNPHTDAAAGYHDYDYEDLEKAGLSKNELLYRFSEADQRLLDRIDYSEEAGWPAGAGMMFKKALWKAGLTGEIIRDSDFGVIPN